MAALDIGQFLLVGVRRAAVDHALGQDPGLAAIAANLFDAAKERAARCWVLARSSSRRLGPFGETLQFFAHRGFDFSQRSAPGCAEAAR